MKTCWLAILVCGVTVSAFAIPPARDPQAASKEAPKAASKAEADTADDAKKTTKSPAVTLLKEISPQESAYKPGRPMQPVVVRSEKEAAALFNAENVAELKSKVDFAKQMVLVFAWQGSGQDQLAFDVSAILADDVVARPEQVVFSFEGGRTRDLRQHARVYALRSDAKWTMGLSWKQAQDILKNGKVQSVMQTHSRQVTIVMDDGTRHETIEPGLDDVIRFLQEIKKDIPIATE